MRDEHRSPIDVFALLLRDDQMLLTRRAGDIPGTGEWALPSGRLEAGEHVVAAMQRELTEELGVVASARDIECFGVCHGRPPDGDARMGFGFLISRWTGEPEIREPDKCSELAWWPVDGLPEPTMRYTQMILELFRGNDILALRGWPGA